MKIITNFIALSMLLLTFSCDKEFANDSNASKTINPAALTTTPKKFLFDAAIVSSIRRVAVYLCIIFESMHSIFAPPGWRHERILKKEGVSH